VNDSWDNVESDDSDDESVSVKDIKAKVYQTGGGKKRKKTIEDESDHEEEK